MFVACRGKDCLFRCAAAISSVHCLKCCVFQAEFDAMLQEFAGEGIPLLASSVPADQFAPFLNDLLPLIMSKTVSVHHNNSQSFLDLMSSLALEHPISLFFYLPL